MKFDKIRSQLVIKTKKDSDLYFKSSKRKFYLKKDEDFLDEIESLEEKLI